MSKRPQEVAQGTGASNVTVARGVECGATAKACQRHTKSHVESPNRPANSARRLVIEASYPL